MRRRAQSPVVIALLLGVMTHALISTLPHWHTRSSETTMIERRDLDHDVIPVRCVLCETGPVPVATLAAPPLVFPIATTAGQPVVVALTVAARRLSQRPIRGPPLG